MKRILALTEACLVERDPATYNIATLKPLGEVRVFFLTTTSSNKGSKREELVVYVSLNL